MQLHRGNLFLIGLMGAGKTTHGRGVAALLDKPFIDSDAELEHRLGRTISEIFENEGEVSFRDREQVLLTELTQREGIVLSTGGGVVLRAANRAQLRANGTVFYLHALPETLAKRLQWATDRPLLQTSEDLLTRLEKLFEIRDPLYRQTAHYTIESTPDTIARLLAAVEENAPERPGME